MILNLLDFFDMPSRTLCPAQTVKKLIHCEREGSGVEGTPEFIPQAEFISAEENPVFLRPDKVQGFS